MFVLQRILPQNLLYAGILEIFITAKFKAILNKKNLFFLNANFSQIINNSTETIPRYTHANLYVNYVRMNAIGVMEFAQNRLALYCIKTK